MEKFIVSARKYRPTKFDSVVGQDQVTDTLRNAILGKRFAHAYLFCGPRGIGKTTCARILAKAINCTDLSEKGEPCNECTSCTSFNSASSFNIYELDAASNSHVDDIRNLIDQVRFPPQSGTYKTYIIDEVHMLSQSAFNAFLKTLEEPPDYAIFILATTEKNKILPTILSRCQIFDFYRIKVDDIAAHLEMVSKKENVEADLDGLHIIAQKADGSLRDALSIFDRIVSFSGAKITYDNVIENLNILDYDYYFKTTDAFLNQDTSSLLQLFNDVTSRGFEGDDFINGLSEHFRNLLISKKESTLNLLEVADKLKEKYQEQSSLTSVSFLVSALNILDQCDVHYKTSKNKRLHVEIALIKLCYLESAIDLAEASKDAQHQPRDPNSTESIKIEPKKKEAVPTDVSVDPVIETEGSSEKKVKISGTDNVSPSTDEHISVAEPKVNIKETPAQSTPESDMPDFRFKHHQASLDTNGTENQKTDITPEYDADRDDPLIMESLEKNWNDYSKLLLEQGNDYMSSLMVHCTPKIINESRFDITVENAVQKELFEEERTSLLQHMREKLKNKSIIMKIEIDESSSEKKNLLYTDRDKFNRMAEKNPLLNELKKRFDLEIDF